TLNRPALTDIHTLSLHDALPISSSGMKMSDTNASGRIVALATAGAELASGVRLATAKPSAANADTPTTNVTTSAGSLAASIVRRSEEHTSELQSRENLVCRLLLE